MSLAEPVSKPSAFLTRVAVLLRNMPVVQFVLARLASLRGIPVAREEQSEPAVRDEPSASHHDALVLRSAAPSLVDQGDLPAAEMTLVDSAFVEQAVDDLPVDDPPIAAAPVVDRPDADASAAEMMAADPVVKEQAVDDQLVDHPPLAAQPSVDQAAVDALVADLTLAAPPVVEQAVEDLLADDLTVAVPPIVDQVAADALAADVTLVDSAGVEPAVDDLPVDDPLLDASPGVEQSDAHAPAANVIVAEPLVLEGNVEDRMAGDLSSVACVAAHLPNDQICAEPEAEPEPDERVEREKLIRRRWMETGIKMWNPNFNGAGRATLNIQGHAGLLPVQPGEKSSRYDTLQFRQVEHGIVCEGVVVEAPRRRN